MMRPANLVEATATIAHLTEENRRLRDAISWIEPPNVDFDADRERMAAQIYMCLTDARRAKSLASLSCSREEESISAASPHGTPPSGGSSGGRAPDRSPVIRDRIGAILFGDDTVSIQVLDGTRFFDFSLNLQAVTAADMARRILDVTGETRSPAALIGLSLAAMSGFGAGIIFTVLAL